MKLLSRSLRSYFIFSALLLLVTVPGFYLVVRAVLLSSVDKSLRLQMADIRRNLPNIRNVDQLQIWSSMDKDIRLSPSSGPFPDRISTIRVTDEEEHEKDPYRQILGSITVNGQHYALAITSSLVENDDLLGSILAVEAVFLLLLLLGMLWITRSISKRIWAPFHETLAAIRGYELNKHQTVSFPRTRIDEFRELNSGLEGLLNKNHEIYLAQKDFTGNAAHEMQTPLAILQSQLELLMQTTPISAEQAGIIQQLEENNQRIIRTNRSLLLLAKIENESFEGSGPVDLTAIVRQLIEQYRPAIQLKRLQPEEDLNTPVILQANRTLVEVLAGNLLSNAIRHNTAGGFIQIRTSEKKLTIRNSGAASGLDAGRMYDRFYKSAESQEGIGLGLSIVQRICDILHAKIGYAYAGGEHEFVIRFS